MSARMTSIDIPGVRAIGFADWGRKTPAEMLALVRQYAQQQLEQAQRTLAAADEDFRIETYVGVHVQRQKEVLQPGRALPLQSRKE